MKKPRKHPAKEERISKRIYEAEQKAMREALKDLVIGRDDPPQGESMTDPEVRIIKERQSGGIVKDYDGNDFEPIQYAIKDSINGKTYYVGYHQITKKIGSVE